MDKIKRDKLSKWDKPVVKIAIYLRGSAKEKFKFELFKGYKETELGLEIMKKHFKDK